MLPFAPIQDLIVCECNPAERIAASGIVVPHISDPDRQIADERDAAKVLAVGPGKKLASGQRRPIPVHIGDVLVFGRNKGMTIRYEGRDYTVLREEHAIGRINGKGFEPLNGVIVAETMREEQKLDSGVVLPKSSDERDEAIVVCVGPGTIQDDGTREEMPVGPGDRILFYKRMAEPFVNDGRELIALKQNFVLCIVESPGR